MRKITFTILLTIICFNVFSQGVRMGLIGSPQISWFSSDGAGVSSDGAIMGFNFGLMTDFFFAERYSFTTGIYINNTGGKLLYDNEIEFKINSGETETIPANSVIRYRLQYLDIPLAFHLESNKIGYFVYHAQFGVTNSIRVGASCDIESMDYDGVGCKDEVSFYNLGYNIGGGIDYYFSKNTALTLSLIYTNGFLDTTPLSENEKTVLRSFALHIGIIF